MKILSKFKNLVLKDWSSNIFIRSKSFLHSPIPEWEVFWSLLCWGPRIYLWGYLKRKTVKIRRYNKIYFHIYPRMFILARTGPFGAGKKVGTPGKKSGTKGTGYTFHFNFSNYNPQKIYWRPAKFLKRRLRCHLKSNFTVMQLLSNIMILCKYFGSFLAENFSGSHNNDLKLVGSVSDPNPDL